MTELVLWLAIACGIAGALTGNRTAWALLASVSLCLLLAWQQVQFDPVLWLFIDFAVIAFVVWRPLALTDWLVLALFLPAWLAYFLPEGPRYIIGLSAVSAQLLLTFPAAAVWARIKRKRAEQPDKWNEFDLRAVHVSGR